MTENPNTLKGVEMESLINSNSTPTQQKAERKYWYPLQSQGALLTKTEFVGNLACDAFFGTIIFGGGAILLIELLSGKH